MSARRRQGQGISVTTASLFLGAVLGFLSTATADPKPFAFLAGEDSLKFNIAISRDERRGEAPHQAPQDVKMELAPLLEKLRNDGKGLRLNTEFSIESYFTVADAFEADGQLVQAVDTLNDLKHKLQDLVDARQGRKNQHSLIETEDDILHFRDSHNLHVWDGKYITGAPTTEKGYEWLKSKGVTTIINLRLPSEHEQALMRKLGLEYVHIPWPDERPPTIQQVNKMLQSANASKGLVFQHCLRGIGRDMTMSGAYMIANHAVSAEKFIAKGRKEAPRWASDQQRDKETGQPVQFELLREFEKAWKKGHTQH